MSQDKQEVQEESTMQRGARLMRVAILALTTAGPVVKTISEWLQYRARSRSREAMEQGTNLLAAAQETGQSVQEELQRRFDEFNAASRQLAADQARQLREQAQQLRAQAKALRRSLRDEARQRAQLQKLVKQAQRKGSAWGRELASRGEALTDSLVSQAGEISQGIFERGSAITQDVIERGSEVTQGLVKRGKRLVQPARRRNRTIWMAIGFGVGLAAAATATYILIRRRLSEQEIEEDEQIELPRHEPSGASSEQSQPVGEIRRLDVESAPVATLPKAEVEASYVGLKSSNHYYTREAFREQFPTPDVAPGDDDLVYFASEEEAKSQGFTAA